MKVNQILKRYATTMFVCAVALSAPALVKADAGNWNVLSDDFSAQMLTLTELGSGGVIGKSIKGDVVKVSWDSFVRADRITPARGPQGHFFLTLRDGDVLAGEPGNMTDETLTWRTPLVGEVTIPLASVRLIELTTGTVGTPTEGLSEDTCHLVNGDVVKGIVSGITSKSVTITAGDAVEVPWDSVARLELASTGKAADVSPKNGIELWLLDGSHVRVKSASLTNETWKIDTASGTDRHVDAASVTAIERIDGPVQWLSARTPIENIQTPFLGPSWLARMDHSVTGGPLRFGSHTYSRGIGVHAYSKLTWDLDGTSRQARLRYAIDGDMAYADVTVRVLLDGKSAFEEAHVKGGKLSDIVTVDLKGAKQLSLEVDAGDGNDVQDRLNWIEAALIK